MSDNQAERDAPVVEQHKTPSLHGVKKRFARRLHWLSIILAPILLIALTISTGYITHPRALDVLHDNDWEALRDWSPHKRHPGNDDLTVAPSADASATSLSSSIFESTTPTSTTEQELPTIPSEAILPTPFPQPWDSDIGQSYDSSSCFNFIANMTAAKEFRTCRPFSLLAVTSSALTKSNLTLSNSIIWGTCNPPPGYDTCVSSMASFATQLEDRCSVDLSKNNTIAMEALLGVQSYPIMYSAGCLSDPSTNVYCYTSAIANTNPADLYTYQLPGGLPLPKSATPSCSACSKSLMSVYADALENSTLSGLEGLKETYDDAEHRMEGVCGQGFARATTFNSGLRTVGNNYNIWSVFLILGVLLSW